MLRTLAILLLGGLALPASGQEEEPLPMPRVEPGSLPEPEVTISPDGQGARVEEYRVGGEVRMIRIVPRNGPPYYLLDNDGDGAVDTRRNELDGININQWILFRW